MTGLQLSHYTHADTLHPESLDQIEREIKPRGLWVSVDGDDDWPTWCREEMPGRIADTNRFRVTLADDANVLHLTGAHQLDEFTRRYPEKNYPGNDHFASQWISWPHVAEHYQGIIIAPYCWPARLNLLWYYGWDCASGCIWDAAAIESVTPLTHATEATR